jgi:cellulose biosynthesis protein BcsQ
MRIISLFNNKGGVGKTTLSFHFANALAEAGKRVLMVDLDPQCNLNLYAMSPDELQAIWEPEDAFIDIEGFEAARRKMNDEEFTALNSKPRTIHYLLKPTEEGTGELSSLAPPFRVTSGLDLIPGRLTLHMFEYKISDRWPGAYQGDPLSIRT